jgi:hypothetical protein
MLVCLVAAQTSLASELVSGSLLPSPSLASLPGGGGTGSWDQGLKPQHSISSLARTMTGTEGI